MCREHGIVRYLPFQMPCVMTFEKAGSVKSTTVIHLMGCLGEHGLVLTAERNQHKIAIS